LSEIADIILQVNRVDPMSNVPYAREDLQATAQSISNFLRDEKFGLERMYVLVKESR
jgi:hypothetical protein